MTDPISKPRRRILTVNCNTGLQTSLASILSRAGYEVGHAANGNVAVQMHRCNPFDAVIIEIVVLERDGLETLIQLTAQASPPKMIAMSGESRIPAELYLTMARHLGAQGALAKPSQLEELLGAVRRVLGET